MPNFTIETSYHLPAYRHRTYSAKTVAEACRLAIDDDNWDGEKLSYESAGETFVSGIWQGRDAAYAGSPIAIPGVRRRETRWSCARRSESVISSSSTPE